MLVDGGFAIGDDVYGRAVDGRVVVLCAASDSLGELARAHDLVHVDWLAPT